MEMEEDRESRFVCKLCDKKYPCGKSLGGHMRSHVIANSAESEERFEPTLKKFSSLNAVRSLKRDIEFGGPSGYGLRENPKKTWRAVDSSFPIPQEKICKQCGKGFQSLKALCGHMACHSEKERVLKDDHSWTSENENQKLVMDSHSDTEGEDPRRLTRSKSKIYKKIVVKSPSFTYANNGSSSVSEIDDQEQQEEVAMCLMMLSRDSGNWGGVNSVVESSDNNSVVLETKSSSIDMRVGIKESLNRFENGNESLKMKKVGRKKLKSSVFDAESLQFENSSSGYLRNGSKKVESDISVDEFLRNGEYKKPKASRVEAFDANMGKGFFNREKCYRSEYKKDFVKENGYGEAAIASSWTKYDSKKRTREEEPSKKTIKGSSFDVEASKSVHKRSKYECLNCNKTFNSHQALGGHRPCHKRVNAYLPSSYESGENSIDGDNSQVRVPNSLSYKKPKAKDLASNAEKRFRPKKIKGHECPICFKIFKSGQALGGHKRSHFLGGSEDRINLTPVTKQDVAEVHDLIDLNLPAPVEDEDNELAHFI